MSRGLFALACAAFVSLAHGEPRTPHERLAFEIFRELVEIDTSADTGDTARAAEAMAARLAAAGLPREDVHVFKPAPRKGNLVARLRGTGTFRPVTDVVFVAVAAGIRECELIASAISEAPQLRRDARFPYHPHVTVAHEVHDQLLDQAFDELATYDARFRVWGFSLFEKGADGVWRPQRDFPFDMALPGPVLPPAGVG